MTGHSGSPTGPGSSAGPDRRRMLGILAAAASAPLIAACSGSGSGSDGLAEQARSGEDKGYISGSGVLTQVPPEERGEPLDLEFPLLDGTTASLADWRPKLVVINLWYAACPPCRKEAPDLEAVSAEFADDAVFLGVNVRDQAAAAEAFIRRFEITYPNMLDDAGEMVGLLSGVLPPQATPSTVVLDAEGRAAARVVGAVDRTTLTGMLEDVRDS